jgi:phage-related protein
MPQTDVLFYKDEDGTVPARDWLQALQQKNRRAFAKCAARIQRLAELGHELRRPEADLLRDGIHELRAKCSHVQYRVLYFFSGRTTAVLAHAITKKGKVPDAEIDRAVRRRAAFLQDPEGHSYSQGVEGNG